MTTLDSQQASPPAETVVTRLGPTEVLVLAAWCGLAGGEFEVASAVVTRALSSTEQIYGITRHFVWLVPLVHLLLFLAAAGLLVLSMRLWPRGAGWLASRLVISLAILEVLVIFSRRVYPDALLVLALGAAIAIAPMAERHWALCRRWVTLSIPFLLGAVALQAGWIFGVDWIKQDREANRPLPAAGSPNVLLIVLDTVRADHLSLYGYPRRTTPNLEKLAERGIRFDQARAAAPWTLPSHANMFTGKWPHELDVKWMCPLGDDAPTLAEYLGSLGYATAGFVGNTHYCSYDSGLDRGFSYYRDHVLDLLNTAHSVRLVKVALTFAAKQLDRYLRISPVTVMNLCVGKRKEAHVVNQEFLDWLSHRPDPGRPFFAFLNYIDAHWPCILPPGESYRLGPGPPNDDELRFLADGRWAAVDKRRFSPAVVGLVRDRYDDCLAYVDQRLGELIDDLERRGVLDQTLLIVTADHGEGFGEHELFYHGESLYGPEIRVPLLIVLPANRRPPHRAVEAFVSLRELPATVVDVIGVGDKSPFPGHSLARFWADRSSAATPFATEAAVLSELPTPNPLDPNQGRGPAHRGALVSLAEGDFVYIRNQGDGSEELFNERGDPGELKNLAGIGAMQPVLRRFRDRLAREMATAPVFRD